MTMHLGISRDREKHAMTHETTAPVTSLVDEVLAELGRAEKTHLDVEVRDIARDAVRLIREQRAELTGIEAMVGMLEDGEWAEHVGQLGGQIARRLETEITRMHNEQQALIARQAAPVAMPDGFSAAIADAERAAIEVFRDSCDHTRQAIEYMAAYLLSAAPTPPAQQSQAVIDVLEEHAKRRHQWLDAYEEYGLDNAVIDEAALLLMEVVGIPVPADLDFSEWLSEDDRNMGMRTALVAASSMILAEIEFMDREAAPGDTAAPEPTATAREQLRVRLEQLEKPAVKVPRDLISRLVAGLEWALPELNREPFEWSSGDMADAHRAALQAIKDARATLGQDASEPRQGGDA